MTIGMLTSSEAENGNASDGVVLRTFRDYEGEPNNNPSHERPALSIMIGDDIVRYSSESWRALINIGQNIMFQKYAFPLVRAIFPELVANSLVSVN